MGKSGRILIVEDDPIMMEVMLENLSSAAYHPAAAENGASAWRQLTQGPDDFEAVLLDRGLPDMDGLELLRRIKQDAALSHIPVILQTAMDAHEDVLEGLRAGAYYYLTKPIDHDTLIAVVETAVDDHRGYQSMRREAEKAGHTLRYLDRAEFSFRRPEQARDIAGLLANACENSQQVVVGLTELMLNAVEHGNLAISYEEKTRLIDDDRLQSEVARRLDLQQYAGRRVRVAFERQGDKLRFLIEDDGDGFDWEPYIEMRPERAFDNHGRGIAIAAKLSFTHLEYQGRGNRVLAIATGETP